MEPTASPEETVLSMVQQDQTLMGQQDQTLMVQQDQTLMVLLQHCRDMKRQETGLRLATWLLLCTCAALCVFAVHLQQRRGEGPHQHGPAQYVSAQHAAQHAAQQGTACSSQANNINKDDPQTNSRRPIIHLNYKDDESKEFINWNVKHGTEYYNKTKRAIVIPQTGLYYIYLRIGLRWDVVVDLPQHENAMDECDWSYTKITVYERSVGYDANVLLMEALENIPCTPIGNRNIYLGQVFDLESGSHIMVGSGQMSKLINSKTTSFGAFLLQ